MARLIDLAQFGWAYMFGMGDAVPPATFNVPAGDPVEIASGGNRATQWQKTAYRLYDLVGPLHYPTTRLARQASQVEWFVRVNGRQLTPDAAKAEINRVTAALGPQEATYLLALNDQIAGEDWYVELTPPENPDRDKRFAVWSVVEKDLDKKIERARTEGRIAIRMWQPHPADPERADSSVRTAIGPAEEYLTLQSLSEAQARSRISQAGIIITPSEAIYGDRDPWEANLVESMQAAIKDVKSASALAPIHVRMRRDLIEFVRYITFPRPYDDLIDRKMERAVIAIANALDIEPEIVQGIGDSSYWNAWAVSMDTYQAHLQPRLDRIGNLYAEVSERLRDRAGSAAVVEITPNPRVMLARRSTVRDALDSLKSGAVGFAFVRDAIGATDGDAPTDEELELILSLFGRGGGGVSDRERRVGENPGPARSGDSQGAVGGTTDLMVAEHARKALGLKLRETWRYTPHRHRLSGLIPSDYTCDIALDDIAREFPIREVVGDAVREVAVNGDAERLTSWILENLTVPISALTAMEEVKHG